MYRQKLMISGLRKQIYLLKTILQDIEQNISESAASLPYQERTAEVAKNLKRLREIHQHHCETLDTPCICQ